jgi:prepilin signal peptidase PulO-like enzyme (type II secretory pathway)
MGKYSTHVKAKPVQEDPAQGCIWRGIGCVMMIVIPAISIFLATVTVPSFWVNYLPQELLGYAILPPFLLSTQGLYTIFGPLGTINNLYALIVVSFLYTVIIGAVISFVYAALYRIVNPTRYGPTDAPPPKVKAKKYVR